MTMRTKRTSDMHLRLTEREHAALVQAAEAEGLSAAEYIRRLMVIHIPTLGGANEPATRRKKRAGEGGIK